MAKNAESWSGISLLPFDGGNYVQAPFEEISEFECHAWLGKVPADVDFGVIDFGGTEDVRLAEAACTGGACEVV